MQAKNSQATTALSKEKPPQYSDGRRVNNQNGFMTALPYYTQQPFLTEKQKAIQPVTHSNQLYCLKILEAPAHARVPLPRR
ncbi:hypothetical protein, partial [uncultured Phascolarctobacterium sp.]